MSGIDRAGHRKWSTENLNDDHSSVSPPDPSSSHSLYQPEHTSKNYDGNDSVDRKKYDEDSVPTGEHDDNINVDSNSGVNFVDTVQEDKKVGTFDTKDMKSVDSVKEKKVSFALR